MASGMTPVTDPSILSQLNGDSGNSATLTPVTDPAILSQLNGDTNNGNGFLDNIANDWKQRHANINNALLQNLTGQRTLPELGLQTAANVAGGAFDVPNEFAKSAWGDNPQKIADAVDSTSAGRLLGNSLLYGKNKIDDFTNAYPRAAENLGAYANILMAGKSGDAASAIDGAGSNFGLGDAMYNSGKQAQQDAHIDYIKNLVTPKLTPSVKEDMASRTSAGNGLFGRNVYNPSPPEQQVIDTVSNIPGISRYNSYQKNLNIIQNVNSSEAEVLKNNIKQNDVQIPDDTIINTLAGVRQNLAQNPYISGVDGSKAADNIVNKALDIISERGNMASSMLDARKQLDNYVASQKGEKTFNPALDSPITTAVQQVRSAMNNMVADAVPSADVKASLQRQSNMYQAIDNVAPKAAGEADTKFGRLVQKVTPHNMGTLVGGGVAVDALAHFIPPQALGAALAGYGLYKGVTAPATRMAIGRSLGLSPEINHPFGN